MTYPEPHLYLTFGGTVGDDIWSFGLRAGPTTFEGLTPTQPAPGDMDDLVAAISTFIAEPNMWISSQLVELNWAKVSSIDTAGNVSAAPSIRDGLHVTGGSTVTTERTPLQISTVVSLWSGSTFGRANYGRFYVPCTNAQLSVPDGHTQSTVATNQRAAAWTFMDDVLSFTLGLSTPGAPCLYSRQGSGTRKEIAWVGVGDVPDTQRRRRNALIESYGFTAFP